MSREGWRLGCGQRWGSWGSAWHLQGSSALGSSRQKAVGSLACAEAPGSRAEAPAVWGPSTAGWTSMPRVPGLPLPEEGTGAGRPQISCRPPAVPCACFILRGAYPARPHLAPHPAPPTLPRQKRASTAPARPLARRFPNAAWLHGTSAAMHPWMPGLAQPRGGWAAAEAGRG